MDVTRPPCFASSDAALPTPSALRLASDLQQSVVPPSQQRRKPVMQRYLKTTDRFSLPSGQSSVRVDILSGSRFGRRMVVCDAG